MGTSCTWGITELRVDVSSPVESAVINNFELKSCDITESGYTALKESGVDEVTFSDSTYQAQVINDASENKMLCVPLFYQKDGLHRSMERMPVCIISMKVCAEWKFHLELMRLY